MRKFSKEINMYEKFTIYIKKDLIFYFKAILIPFLKS